MSNPNTTLNRQSADLPAGVDAQKILLIGQKLSTGSATTGELIKDVKFGQIDGLFGKKSVMGGMLYRLFKTWELANSNVAPTVDVIPLDDSVSTPVKATGKIALADTGATGVATETGEFNFSIGGYDVTLPVTLGETIADLDAKLVALVNAIEYVPVTASESTGCALEFNNAGTVGNGCSVVADTLLIGNVQVTLTAFTSGATDPVGPELATLVGDERYQRISAPYEYGTDYIVADFLETRFNYNNDVLDGSAIFTDTNSLSLHKDALALINKKTMTLICNKENAVSSFYGGGYRHMNYEISAIVVALASARLTEDFNISSFTPASNSASKDGFGGVGISSLPYANSDMDLLDPFDTTKVFGGSEIIQLNDLGGSAVTNNSANNGVVLDEILTTYKTDGSGNDDATWKFQNIIDQASIAAEYIFRNLKKDVVQSRMTPGQVVDGRAIETKDSMKAKLLGYYKELAEETVVPKGSVYEEYFLSKVSVEFDLIEGKITLNSNLPLVVQIRKIIATLKMDFTEV